MDNVSAVRTELRRLKMPVDGEGCIIVEQFGARSVTLTDGKFFAECDVEPLLARLRTLSPPSGDEPELLEPVWGAIRKSETHQM